MATTDAGDGGFTLLEVLVTLAVLGLLLLGLAQAIHTGLLAWAIEQRVGGRVSGLETTERALRRLFERASPSVPDAPAGALVGTAGSVAFVTTLPDGLGGDMMQEVDATLLVADDHRLELRWRPHYRRWLVAPSAPAAIVLLDDVDHLELGYRQAGVSGQGWLSSWASRDLPRFVRLRVVFRAGDPRRWPDIVAEPMRDRPAR